MELNVKLVLDKTSCGLRMTLRKLLREVKVKDTGKISVADWHCCDANPDPTLSILVLILRVLDMTVARLYKHKI
jgi:hypothetical protein